MPITRIRNSTMARWFERPFGEVERFHRAACFVSALRAARGQRDAQARRHLLHAGGDDEVAGRRSGHEHLVVAIAVHGDADAARPLRPARYPRGRTTHTAGWPLFCVIADAGIAAAGASPTGRSTTSVAVAPSGSGRGVAGFRRARNVRVCAAACGDSSRNATSNVCSGALASHAL